MCECLRVSSCLSNITIFSNDTPFAVKGDKSEGWKKGGKNVGFGKSLSGKPLGLCSCMFLYRRENISFREMFPLWPFSHFLTHIEVNHITHNTPCYQFLLDINPIKDASFINFLNVFHHFHFYLALFNILFICVMFHSCRFWLSQTTKTASTDAFSWRNY